MRFHIIPFGGKINIAFIHPPHRKENQFLGGSTEMHLKITYVHSDLLHRNINWT